MGQSQTLTLSPDAMCPLGGTCVSRSPLSFVCLWGTVSKQQWCRVQRGSREAARLGRPQLLCPLATSPVQSGLCCCLSFEAGTPETCSGHVGPAVGFVCARTLEGGHGCCLCSRYLWVSSLIWERVPAVWHLRRWGSLRAPPLRPSPLWRCPPPALGLPPF